MLSASFSLQALAQLPLSFDVTGGGLYCGGGSGLPVGLSGSETDIIYTLYRNGSVQITTVIGTGSEISFGDQQAGVYTVTGTNYDGTTEMGGSAVITESPLPAISVTSPPLCSPDLLTYSIEVTVSSGTVTSSAGTVNNTGGKIWSITEIPAGINIIVTVADENSCERTLSVSAPDCSCPFIAAPISGGNKSYCETDPVPAITATVQTGETVDWYDSAAGGALLLSESLEFTPPEGGTYYAEARNTVSNCTSSTRKGIVVTMYSLPVVTLSCSDADYRFYSGTSITFTASGGNTYEFKVDEMTVQNGMANTFITASLSDGQVVSVTVTNSNGCSATSDGITVSVISLPSGWVINPGEFTYNGLVTAKVLIDFTAVESGYLAAFVGAVCRGIAEPEYLVSTGQYILRLSCYSNNTTGESLTFKFYDPVEDIIYDLNKTILFNANMAIGSETSPVEMHNTINKSISFTTGWNWFSVNAQNENMTLNNILTGVSVGDYIKDQLNSATYLNTTGWFGSLTVLNPVSLYKIKVQNGFIINFPGVPVDINSTSINLLAGWNWIGYLPQETMPVDNAFSTLSLVELDYIKNNTKSATYYKNYGWFGTLTELLPNEGYMIKLANPGTLVYPVVVLKKGNMESDEKGMDISNAAEYQYNGSVTASVLVDGVESVSENDILYAYVKDEVRGIVHGKYFSPVNNSIFTLMIHSNIADGELVEFRFYDASGDKTYPCSEKILFRRDMIVGDAINSYKLNVKTSILTSSDNNVSDGFVLNAYPNPFSNHISIEYNLPEISHVTLSVYNTTGKLVRALVGEDQLAGHYSIKWNSDAQPEGIYILKFQVGLNQKVIKISLVR